MSSEPRQNQDKFILRLPDGMRDQVKQLAASNHRSMNAEILAALEMWLGDSRIGMDKAEFRQLMRDDAEQQLATHGEDFPQVSIRHGGRVIDYVPHPKHLKPPEV
ncbi:Arc family DNA-binding protein [Marinovum algicola]|uniref:Arc family DNA-binding protein n=1 Tax=Marinovum algicola TaxID=42444 RepID=UPI00352A5A79